MADTEKKSGLAIILGLGRKPKAEDMGESMSESDSKEKDDDAGHDHDEACEACCDEVLDAVENKDGHALCDALRAFVAMCDEEEDEGESEEA